MSLTLRRPAHPTLLTPLLALFAGLLLFSPRSAAQVTTNPSATIFNAPGTTVAFTVSVASSTSLGSVAVLSMGAPTSEFTSVPGGTTCPALTAGTCKVSVLFQPTAPGRRFGALVLNSPSGEVLLATSLMGIGLSPLIAFSPGAVAVLAGGGTGGDGGLATAAALKGPTGIAEDGFGNHYIADPAANNVRKVTPAGLITTFAGTGVPGFSGDGGLATSAKLSGPMSVLLDGAGFVYIADTGNHVVRVVSPAGVISTYAGQYYAPGASPPAVCAKATNAVGDGCPGNQIVLDMPVELVWCHTQNLHIADQHGNRIRTVMRTSYNTITQAGTGAAGYDGDGLLATSSALNGPSGMAMDAGNFVYIADSGNHLVRKTYLQGSTPFVMKTIAGLPGNAGSSGDGGLAAQATLNAPYGVQVDPAGNVYFSDSGGQVVRQVNVNSGLISTVAGNATTGFNGPGGALTQSSGPSGLLLDGKGDLFVVDQAAALVRKITLSAPPALALPDTIATATSTAQTVVVLNAGSAPLSITAVTAPADFSLGGEQTSCTHPGNQQRDPGTSCTLAVAFAPRSAGALSGSVVLADNAGTGAQSIHVAGTASPLLEGYGLAVAAPSVTMTGSTDSTQTLTLTSATFTGTVSFVATVEALDGGPFTLAASAPPVSLTAGGTGSTAVTITAHGQAALRTTNAPGSSAALFCVALLGAPLVFRRKGKKALLSLGLLFALTTAMVACGGTDSSTRMYLVTVTPVGSAALAASATVTNPAAVTFHVTAK